VRSLRHLPAAVPDVPGARRGNGLAAGPDLPHAGGGRGAHRADDGTGASSRPLSRLSRLRDGVPLWGAVRSSPRGDPRAVGAARRARPRDAPSHARAFARLVSPTWTAGATGARSALLPTIGPAIDRARPRPSGTIQASQGYGRAPAPALAL